MKEVIEGNIFFHALPYALLISVPTIIGVFGGFALGKLVGGSVMGFVCSLVFSFLGFFIGLFITYCIVKERYLKEGS